MGLWAYMETATDRRWGIPFRAALLASLLALSACAGPRPTNIEAAAVQERTMAHQIPTIFHVAGDLADQLDLNSRGDDLSEYPCVVTTLVG